MPRRTTALAVERAILLLGLALLYLTTYALILASNVLENMTPDIFDEADPGLLILEPVIRSALGAGILDSERGI